MSKIVDLTVDLGEIAHVLPPPVERALRYIYSIVPPKIRYGKAFWQMCDFLKESQWWSAEKLYDYQMQKLSRILRHAYEKVPYYRKAFDEAGVKPEDIQNLDDIRKLPLLEKESIRDNLQDFLASGHKARKLHYETTSGSTGIPFGVYQTKSYYWTIVWAFMYTQWRRVGYEMGVKSIVLRGKYIGNPKRNDYWRYDPVRKELNLSSYHLTNENMPRYLEQMRKFEPDFIQAYPSALCILARYIVDNNITQLPEMKAILASSENLYPWQRKLLELAFNCGVFTWYGHAEWTVLGSQCEFSNYYHIFPEYGYTEILDTNGNKVTKDGEIGEIVGTGFHNFAMPLIRYKTRDLAVVAEGKCDKCGRNYPLLQRIEGRLQELVVTKNGRLITMTTIASIHSDVFDKVKQFQFYQDTIGEVVFNIVKKPKYRDEDTKRIRRALATRLGDDVKLIINFVDNIPLTKSGKHRYLIQKLPIEWSD
jgi:phenylacetate-CoA ligase